MTWERGREKIERLLVAGELERVTASADVGGSSTRPTGCSAAVGWDEFR